MQLVGLRVKLLDGGVGNVTGGELNVDMDNRHFAHGVPIDELRVVDPDEEEDVAPVDMVFRGGR